MKKFISVLLTLALCVCGLPLAAGAAENIVAVADQGDVREAVKRALAGSVIEITGTGFVGEENGGTGEPWVIDKSVTIRSKTDGAQATLNVRTGGIVLGADVTFENIKLALPNRMRNAIMANGHTLTLTGVAGDTSVKHKTHLFCGGLTNSSFSSSIPSPGSKGEIVIKDCTNLGNIYAGSLSGNGENNSFTRPATVTIQSGGAGSVGTLYGCGAKETPVDDSQLINPDAEVAPPAADAEKYKVTDAVTFNLYHTTTSRVEGATGGSQNAAVCYNGTADLNDTLFVENIASLAVASGNLAPKTENGLGKDINLTVSSGTTLGLANLRNAGGNGNTLEINNFSGGGTLVLDEYQAIIIEGNVTGTTSVGVKAVQNGLSQTTIAEGRVPVQAKKSTDNSFRLIPPSNQTTMTLVRDENGAWTTQLSAVTPEKTLVQNLTINDKTIKGEQTGVEIPCTVTFAAQRDGETLSHIPLGVTINGQAASQDKGTDNCYSHKWTHAGTSFTLRADANAEQFKFTGNNGATIPAGTYAFAITVPKENSATGSAQTVTFTLTVEDTTPQPPKPVSVAIPTAIAGLHYTGQVQFGVTEGTGYTLSGNSAVDVGSYTAVATLKDGYMWADGSTGSKNISWSIAVGESPAAPSGLTALAPTREGGYDGIIKGTTTAMEYAADSIFSRPVDCTGDTIRNLGAGTYYVRLKATGTCLPGQAAAVKVPEYNEVVIPDGETPDDTEPKEPAVTTTVPVSGEQNTVQVSAGVSETTAVVDQIDTTHLDNVIGEKVKTGMVEIDFTGLKTTIDTVQLPAATVGEICTAVKSEKNDADGLALRLSTGTVSFDAAALESISKHASGQLTLKIVNRRRQELTTAQQKETGSAPVVELTLRSTGAITDFGTGKATVTLPYVLKPGQTAPGMVVYHLESDAKTTACPTSCSQVANTVTFTTGHFSLYFVGFDANRRWINPFVDVSSGAWHYDAVQFVEINDLMNGKGNRTFAPDSPLSRAELAQILYNKEGRPTVRGSIFSDVPAGEWYADAVNWAAQRNYVKGYDSSHFGPNDPVTREQLAAILWRCAGEPAMGNTRLPFTDAGRASSYALPALRWATAKKIVNGKGNNRLDPTGTATRAEVAQMLMNYLSA